MISLTREWELYKHLKNVYVPRTPSPFAQRDIQPGRKDLEFVAAVESLKWAEEKSNSLRWFLWILLSWDALKHTRNFLMCDV